MLAGIEKAPRVTIAVPTFNRPGRLEICLSRLLGQIDPDTEIFVSDNASGPETAAVLARFTDPRLRKSRNENNIGLFPNLNHCLAQAAGEFVLFLSDDDFIDDDFVGSCLMLLQRKDAVPHCSAIIASNRFVRMVSGRKDQTIEHPTLIETGFYNGEFLLEQLWLYKISFQLCGILFRTEALRSVGGFTTEHRFAGDVYTFGAAFLGRKIGFLSSPKCTYVLHPESETSALGLRFRMMDIGSVLSHITATARRVLPLSHSIRLSASAHWYMTTEYLHQTLDLRRGGASRGQCLLTIMPSIPWMIGRGGRFRWTISRLIFELIFPLWLRELFWTLSRLMRRFASRARTT